mmetsp:Transcript_11032/g.21047  ORF Transcript_11032/g.21047 Transcript_11032/m.21047 type:complete len:91 (+) Transcript_11032:29-301(+)
MACANNAYLNAKTEIDTPTQYLIDSLCLLDWESSRETKEPRGKQQRFKLLREHLPEHDGFNKAGNFLSSIMLPPCDPTGEFHLLNFGFCF